MTKGVISGRCYCGDTAYEYTGKVFLRAQCHCRECQYYSGGGPNYFMLGAQSEFRFTKGEPRDFTRPDLDQPVHRQFCPTCMTSLVTLLDNGTVVMKAGTLDDPSDYAGPQAAIYMCDTTFYQTVPDGVPTFDKLPPRG